MNASPAAPGKKLSFSEVFHAESTKSKAFEYSALLDNQQLNYSEPPKEFNRQQNSLEHPRTFEVIQLTPGSAPQCSRYDKSRLLRCVERHYLGSSTPSSLSAAPGSPYQSNLNSPASARGTQAGSNTVVPGLDTYDEAINLQQPFMIQDIRSLLSPHATIRPYIHERSHNMLVVCLPPFRCILLPTVLLFTLINSDFYPASSRSIFQCGDLASALLTGIDTQRDNSLTACVPSAISRCTSISSDGRQSSSFLSDTPYHLQALDIILSEFCSCIQGNLAHFEENSRSILVDIYSKSKTFTRLHEVSYMRSRLSFLCDYTFALERAMLDILYCVEDYVRVNLMGSHQNVAAMKQPSSGSAHAAQLIRELELHRSLCKKGSTWVKEASSARDAFASSSVTNQSSGEWKGTKAVASTSAKLFGNSSFKLPHSNANIFPVSQQEIISLSKPSQPFEMTDLTSLSVEDSRKTSEVHGDTFLRILEFYHQEASLISSFASHTINELDHALQIMELHLSSVRNTALKSELVLDFLGMIFGFIGAVAGVFGMNLRNGYEGDRFAFKLVVVTTSAIFVLALAIFIRFVRMMNL